jgi:hypothetical protein
MAPLSGRLCRFLDVIRVDLSSSHNITTFTVRGKITRDEILSVLERAFPNLQTAHTVWDFSDCSLELVEKQDFALIRERALRLAPQRRAGRTAIVGSSGMIFASACVYAAESALAESPINCSAFRSVADAMAWIEHAN